MEKLQQIQQTLSEIDGRVPAALRVALRIGYNFSPAPPDIATFAASLLPTPATDVVVATATTPDEELVNSAAAPPALSIRYGSCYLPLHDHDAHFGHAGAGVLAVADGVGAYARLGVDAGEFARGLMASALAAVEELGGATVSPYALLEAAYERTAATGAAGASTAVIVSLVGDSGFAVLRRGRIVCRSTPQQRSLNSPFRLSGRSGGDSDGVAVARTGEVAARDGDIVVVATDGLSDNVGDEQLERVNK
nr:unnamed protein product [Digitaria exilis]